MENGKLIAATSNMIRRRGNASPIRPGDVESGNTARNKRKKASPLRSSLRNNFQRALLNAILLCVIVLFFLFPPQAIQFLASFQSDDAFVEKLRVRLGLCALSKPLQVHTPQITRFSDMEKYLHYLKEWRDQLANRTDTDAAETQVEEIVTLDRVEDGFARTGELKRLYQEMLLPRNWHIIKIESNQVGEKMRELVQQRIHDSVENPKTLGEFAAQGQLPKVCISSGHAREKVNCLPHIYIVGFEKCSTTWLSQTLAIHPNILVKPQEARFFDQPFSAIMDTLGNYVLNIVPTMPGGYSGIGKYRIVEKSPAYATAMGAPFMVSQLIANAKLIFATRNPMNRAYSMFGMYCEHYRGATDVIWHRPVSYFVRSTNARETVRYVGEVGLLPGKGGSHSGEWQYIRFPPDPTDFHDWIVHYISQSKDQSCGAVNIEDNSRPHRIIFGGCYLTYIERWLKYFPPSSIVLAPSEMFDNKADAKLERLQLLLGLPYYNYTRVGTVDEGGKFHIKSPASYMNGLVNSYSKRDAMLETTRKILDDFYCEEIQALRKRLLRNQKLPGYPCGE